MVIYVRRTAVVRRAWEAERKPGRGNRRDSKMEQLRGHFPASRALSGSGKSQTLNTTFKIRRGSATWGVLACAFWRWWASRWRRRYKCEVKHKRTWTRFPGKKKKKIERLRRFINISICSIDPSPYTPTIHRRKKRSQKHQHCPYLVPHLPSEVSPICDALRERAAWSCTWIRRATLCIFTWPWSENPSRPTRTHPSSLRLRERA